MQRYDAQRTGLKAQINSATKAIAEEMNWNDPLFPSLKLHGSHGYSPNNVRHIQPYGMATYLPGMQKSQQQQTPATQGNLGGSEGGGPGSGGMGAGDIDHNQPKGLSAEGYIQYAGDLSHPFMGAMQFPDHQVILGKPKKQDQQGGQQGGGSGGQQSGGQQEEEESGFPGDTVHHHMRDQAIQGHYTAGDGKDLKPGYYLSAREDKSRLRFQLVEHEDDQQQGGQGGQGGAGGSGGQGGQSGQGQQGEQKSKGQKPLLRKKSSTFIDVIKDAVHAKRGEGNMKVQDKDIMTFYKDETISTRVTDKHVHIRHGANRIFVDDSGCWTTKPIEVKADPDTSSSSGSSAGAAALGVSASEHQLRWQGILKDPGRIEMATLLQRFSGPDIDRWIDDNVHSFDDVKTVLKSLLKAQART